MELTEKQKLVLDALSKGDNHGYQICKSTGLLLGSVYNILIKLEENGLCQHEWKKGRKYYYPTLKINR